MGKVIAIISVAREETGYFKSLTAVNCEQDFAGMDFYSGMMDEAEVVLVCSGMGKLSAAVAAQVAVDRFNVDTIIASGPAGPLVPYLQQGDIVIADRLIQYFPDDQIPSGPRHDLLSGDTTITADPEFVRRITGAYNDLFGGKSNRPQLVMGTVVSSDYAISERKTVGRLLRDYAVVAIDRNGATLAQVCRMNRTPFLLIRTAVDTPNGEFYNYFDSQLQVVPEYITALVRHFVTAPFPVAAG